MHVLRRTSLGGTPRARRERSRSPPRASRGRARRAASPPPLPPPPPPPPPPPRLPSTLDVDPAVFARAALGAHPREGAGGAFTLRGTAAKLRSSARRAFPPARAQGGDGGGVGGGCAGLGAGDLGGVQRLLLRARARGEPVNPAAVSLGALRRVTLRAGRGEVLVQGGATLGELRAAEVGQGFCVRGGPRPGAERWSDAAPVARAVLFGAFPAGCVRRLSFVDARGRLRVVGAAAGADRAALALFAAARVSLGLLGVLYDVAFAVEVRPPAVAVENLFPPVARFFDRGRPHAVLGLRDVVEGDAEEVEVTWTPFSSAREGDRRWYPHRDDVWVRVLRRTSEPETAERSRRRLDTIPQWLHANAVQLSSAGYAGYSTADSRLILANAGRSAFFAERARRTVEPLAEARARYKTNDRIAVHVVQVALPLSDEPAWTALHAAVCRVIRKVERCDSVGEYPLNVGLRIRFVNADDAMLSPAYEPDKAKRAGLKYALLSIATAEQTRGWTEFAQNVFAGWMKIPGARPTWDCPPPVVDEKVKDFICRTMGPALQRLAHIRRAAGIDDVNLFEPCPTGKALGVLKLCKTTQQPFKEIETPVAAEVMAPSQVPLKPTNLPKAGLAESFDRLTSPVSSVGASSSKDLSLLRRSTTSESPSTPTAHRSNASEKTQPLQIPRVSSWYDDARETQADDGLGLWPDDSNQSEQLVEPRDGDATGNDNWVAVLSEGRDILVAVAFIALYVITAMKAFFSSAALAP